MALTRVRSSGLFTDFVNGPTVVDHWYLNADHTTDGTSDLTAWTQVTTAFTQTAKLSGMSHSSGIFTFPQTGLYKVSLVFCCRSDSSDHMTGVISVTTDNSTYNSVVNVIHGDSDTRNGGAFSFGFINVTDTSNVKVKFVAESMNSGSYVLGSASEIRTSVMFERIADAQ